ncbi:TetR/AcrR family transcriptional regulator [uncultured Maritimibacter sp.]|uniref:TetR/AcrR family transcriptional regulator n=1 Tax=uncultured Maritimibacter sp. TaxID=991866 RepID=UPI002594D2A0|nr:TetR/AcrR family transcriptional regulator [uncultured Maritimibacter sp.]
MNKADSRFESDAFRAVLDAVEKEEGPSAPKKRLAILAALDCFAEFGFDGTSTKMIAERAGIGEATIFRHFPSKKALLLRITQPVVRHILTPAAEQEAHELIDRHKGDRRAVLRAVMLSRLHFMRVYEPLVKILLQEALVNPDLRAVMIHEATPLFDQLSGTVAMFGPQNELERERFFRTLGSFIMGYFLHRSILAPNRDWDDATEVDFMLTVMFDGLDATLDRR